MSKYICVEDFANELKNFACKQCKENKEDAEGWKCGGCSVMYFINALNVFPAADVEPVIHAKWIKIYDYTECSNCEYWYSSFDTEESDDRSEYCPSCGAKMDKE